MQNDKNLELDIYYKQYELCLKLADKISERRGITNKFYSALLLAFLSVIVNLFKNDSFSSNFSLILLCILGVALCIIWHFNILSYKTLNSAKFSVITALEKDLPTNPISAEYIKLNDKKYLSLTEIETWVPRIFGIVFIILLFINSYFVLHLK